ncbi:MAG: hypothetical protein RBS76_02600 [Acholeplasmatales bacterium]|jgi:predicted NBD/HSP70 family sugar kinase|nr:hypothetical protein [Acholeplasmataceae bacterium]MCK9288847.1 hypothetical protein [Acholeplasmataceae bacterium]MCK9427247.1 hypothetical protein [Acholeplasmataceae bacterium]MDY0115373.1 hypothetical protein [Acholeplasmatales bacterium]HHT39172.1 ROK family protein [Acholeplasmataceae bacterium]
MKIKAPKVKLKLDQTFAPAILYLKEFKKQVLKQKAHDQVTIVIERNNGYKESYQTIVFQEEDNYLKDNLFYLERLIKTLLWVYGGYKIIFVGPHYLYLEIKEIFEKGERLFDANFMERIYEKPFLVEFSKVVPPLSKSERDIGKHFGGYRIGFDAGGSDMKVSALKDGEVVYSEEIVWYPKLNDNPRYHQEMIRKAIYKAKEKLPKVEALGVSSAGVYIDNQARVASLFIKVPLKEFNDHIKNIYLDIARELKVPIEVVNDGEVTALAGSMSLSKNKLLGIAMGTSEAVGYVNSKGMITGWLNELAFAPVDFQVNGPLDEWSLDRGVGCKYFSQDAVIRLAKKAGFKFQEGLHLGEKLKAIQSLDSKSELYQNIYLTIGAYLGYSLAYYSEFYDFENVLLLGRVMSGVGGKIIVKTAEEVLKQHFANLSAKITLYLPDEKTRRVGQSIAAASLVNLEEERK